MEAKCFRSLAFFYDRERRKILRERRGLPKGLKEGISTRCPFETCKERGPRSAEATKKHIQHRHFPCALLGMCLPSRAQAAVGQWRGGGCGFTNWELVWPQEENDRSGSGETKPKRFCQSPWVSFPLLEISCPEIPEKNQGRASSPKKNHSHAEGVRCEGN
eukprot:TRINITY_DN5003_c0_g1_i1.p2 TRINITY_DN5003_c0_g1~~TRINITY_DN5003_c0_g1_i1.p2  ORF type:complete len:161 (-),score=9.06 TRINITY_DN5003_c0_g1_i1:85-567(-)